MLIKKYAATKLDVKKDYSRMASMHDKVQNDTEPC